MAARRKERAAEQDAEDSRSLRHRREVAQQLFDVFAALHDTANEPSSTHLADLVWSWVLDYPLDKPGGLPRMLREFQHWYQEHHGHGHGHRRWTGTTFSV